MLKRLFKHPFVFLTSFMLIVTSLFIFTYLPPKDSADNLQLLIRDNSTDPIFKLKSQINLSTFFNSQTNTLPNDNYNFYYQITDDKNSTISNNFERLSSLLYKLKDSFLSQDINISLSILPSNKLSDSQYISLCTQTQDFLVANGLDNLSIIIFPKNPEKLLEIPDSTKFTHIGTNINTFSDLEAAAKLHETFGDTKTLYIRDNILFTHVVTTRESNTPLPSLNGSLGNDINLMYYTLATSLPKYQTIFSPYDTKKNTLAFNINNEASYTSIYSNFLEQPWITDQDVEVSSTSPYTPLSTYDEISGNAEIIISPESEELLSAPGLLYKINEVVPTSSPYKPYSLFFDTSNLPNGINRIKGVSQNLEPTIVHSIDIIINNSSKSERAVRYVSNLEASEIGDEPADKKGYIPILMYHTISDTVAPENQNSCVSTQIFDSQMSALINNGYHPISFKQLYDYINGKGSIPKKPVIITMDDGYLNNYTHAYPIYKKYNIQATMFVSPYYIKDDNTDRHFGWEAAAEMESSGLIDIQPHGYDHTPLPYLSLKDVKYHISQGLGLIEHKLGPRDVRVVSYPQFRNTFLTKNTLSDLGINLQITNLITLAQKNKQINSTDLKRINVPNTMSANDLINTLDSYR